MSMSLIAILAAVSFVAAFIQGSLGIGFALIVAPVVGMLKPDLLPVTLLLLMLPLNLHVAARERAHVDWPGATWITIGRFAGTFAGLWLLAALSVDQLDLAVGIFTVVAAGAALVAPPFTYGYKSHQKSGGGNHLPGTTSLDGATLVAALRDVIKEFARHGVRRICLVNGHFENSWFIVEGIDLALRELRWGGIDDMKIVVLSYWDFVDKPTIARLYPEGFTGWDIEHGGVLETSLMLALHPNLVHLDRAVDHPPATFPPYDVYPPHKEWTPASGTLSSPKASSLEKGEVLLDVCTRGIVGALRSEFPAA